ncbi:unnamed protein product [Brassica oleracea var. botrytis]
MPFVISGDLKRIFETELSLRYLSYLANVSLKINVKMGGRKTDAVSGRVPLVSDIPTIIFGADVTHPENGEVGNINIMLTLDNDNFPKHLIYADLVCAQAHRQ